MKSLQYERDQVCAVDSPEFTDTWHPFSHNTLIHYLDEARKSIGVGIRKETYSMTKDMKNMFGVWVLDEEREGMSVQVGFRNSIDKKIAIGIVSGTHVIVCSNMQFKGEFIELQRHTGNFLEEGFPTLCLNAFNKAIERGNEAIDWHLDLKNYPLERPEMKKATFDAMEKGILSPRSFDRFMSAYKEENYYNPNSLFAFHGAITQVARELNLFTQNSRANKLVDLVEYYKIAA